MEIVEKILNALFSENISPCITVPCKCLAPLLERLENIPARELIYPAREEEGLGICAGAYLAGRFPILIIQNSGLGNLVNAYCSLNRYFQIPVFFLISHRGDETEKIEAQKPMGSITVQLLDILGIEHFKFERPEQFNEMGIHLRVYKAQRKSQAILLSPKIWR